MYYDHLGRVVILLFVAGLLAGRCLSVRGECLNLECAVVVSAMYVPYG